MNENIVVDIEDFLSDENGCLVICYKTGINYTAQTGGLACSHPVVEGFLIKVFNLEEYIDFDDCKLGCWHKDGNIEHANAIDRCLQKYNVGRKEGSNIDDCIYIESLRFNYEKIKELTEGWWPVLVTYKMKEVIWKPSGLGEYVDTDGRYILPGYIHMGNCD